MISPGNFPELGKIEIKLSIWSQKLVKWRIVTEQMATIEVTLRVMFISRKMCLKWGILFVDWFSIVAILIISILHIIHVLLQIDIFVFKLPKETPLRIIIPNTTHLRL
jgi:hypothetical protein